METLGVIPAEGTGGAAPTGAMRTVLGLPLFLWAVNNLLRAMPLENVVVVTASPDIEAMAARRNVRTIGPESELDTGRLLVHDPARCFCSAETVLLALESGEHELAALRTSPIERLRCDSEDDLELMRAVAAGLAPDHPVIRGARRMRLAAPVSAGGPRLDAVISDVDGVLTDGRVHLNDKGVETRGFHMHDGLGVRLLIERGVRVGWLSAAKDTGAVRKRAERLGVQDVDISDGEKGQRFLDMCARLGANPKQTLYIGDDVNDLPAMERAGLSACPIDARPAVRARVDLVLEAQGGAGALREVVEMVLDDPRPESAPS